MMKIKLELNIIDNDNCFLNFWNSLNGDDVILDIKKGKLFNSNGVETSLQEFIDNVKVSFTNAVKELE